MMVFYDISTVMSYLMPNTVFVHTYIYIYICACVLSLKLFNME